MAQTAIDINSTPVFCWFGGSDCWNCIDFITWHKALVSAYGQSKANTIFITSWSSAPFINTAYDCRSFDSSFRQYAKDNGFFDALYSGLGVIAEPIGVGTDIVHGAGNIVSNTVGGAENTSKIIKWLIPALVVIGAILLIWWAIKHFNLIKR